MKRLENICMENQISFHQCKDSLDQIFNPNHSNTYTHANPSAHNLKAAQKHHRQPCIFSRKLKYWKHVSKAFQDQITTPLACQGYQETIPIKNIVPYSRNWYIKVILFTKIFIIVSWILCIFHMFLMLIYANWIILKLTTYINSVFVHYRRIHHGRLLGF